MIIVFWYLSSVFFVQKHIKHLHNNNNDDDKHRMKYREALTCPLLPC